MNPRMNERTRRLYGWWREIAGAIVVLISRIVTAPRTPWENDEFLFAEAVRKFDPSRYHPHPPGYPLYILLGKLVNAIVGDPWRALVIVSIIAAPIGFVALARVFRRWIDDPDSRLPRGDKAAHLRHQSQKGDLPDEDTLAAHVRACD